MATNCLNKRVKGSVDNDNLPILGAYQITVIQKSEGVSANDFKVKFDATSGKTLKVSAPNGKIYTSESDWTNDTNGTTSVNISSESDLWFKNGNYKVTLMSKYNVKRLQITDCHQFSIEPIDGMSSLDTLNLGYCQNNLSINDIKDKNLTRFQVTYYEGDTLDISTLKASRIVVNNSTGIVGNIETIAGNKWVIELWGSYSGLAGSAGGTVEGFVETCLRKIVNGDYNVGNTPTNMVVHVGTLHGLPNNVSLTISYNKTANSASVSVTNGAVVATYDGSTWTYA